ncbi:MAG: LruC domain-containing protein [Deltaproteobacteria bacterium]|nr:LruC domain-containing protein [Deltaproteobacteria bacterium]
MSNRLQRNLPLGAVCLAATLAACSGQVDKFGRPFTAAASNADVNDVYVTLSVGFGPGYTAFTSDPYGGIEGRDCNLGPIANTGMMYTPNDPGLNYDEVHCLARLILMVAGHPEMNQDLLYDWLQNYQPAGNVTLLNDTHTSSSRTTDFTVAHLGLTIHLEQTVVGPSKFVQVYTITSATDQTLRLIDSDDTDLPYHGNPGTDYVSAGPFPEASLQTGDYDHDVFVKMTGADNGTYEGYHTEPGYSDPYFVSTTRAGFDLSDLNNGPGFGDAHGQLQFSAPLQAGVPFVHTVTWELPGPIANCDSLIGAPALDEHGLLMFEDLWPGNGDLDFNDEVFGYNETFDVDANGKVAAMTADLSVLATGATIHNGAYLHLPLPANAASAIYLTDSNGIAAAVSPMAGEHELVLEFTGDTHALFDATRDYQNTNPTDMVSHAKRLQLRLEFATPVDLDVGAAPFDLFIAQSGNFGHQIHLMSYAGTDQMDTGLFGTGNDASGSGAHFVNAQGLPFALALPAPIGWPTERTSIDAAYPQIVDWAQSAGALNPNWYESPTAGSTFSAGADGPAPAPAFVDPTLTAICH